MMNLSNLQKVIDKETSKEQLDVTVEKDTKQNTIEEVVEEEVSIENLSIVANGLGGLTAVEDIEEEDDEVVVSSESLLAGAIEDIETNGQQPHPRHNCDSPLGVYSRDGKHVSVVIAGEVTRAMTLAPGIIASATQDMTLDVTIVSAFDHIGRYVYMELEQAIRLSKATVKVHLDGSMPVAALSLLFTNVDVEVGVAGVVIEPPVFGTQGSTENVIEIVEAYNSYANMLYTELEESGILTTEDIDKLKSRSPIHITNSVFMERYSAMKTAQ